MHLFFLKKYLIQTSIQRIYPFILIFCVYFRLVVLEEALEEAHVENDNNLLNHSHVLVHLYSNQGFWKLQSRLFFIQMTKRTKHMYIVRCACIIHISPEYL